MDLQDIQIKCATCGREFIFTVREQEFFHSKGFKEPRHCRECRQKRKQDREKAFAEASGQTYEDKKEAFKIICASCQREAVVPFKPITGKPVLCKDCFIAQRYGERVEKQDDAPPARPEPAVKLEHPAPDASNAAGPVVDLEAQAAAGPPIQPEEPLAAEAESEPEPASPPEEHSVEPVQEEVVEVTEPSEETEEPEAALEKVEEDQDTDTDAGKLSEDEPADDDEAKTDGKAESPSI